MFNILVVRINFKRRSKNASDKIYLMFIPSAHLAQSLTLALSYHHQVDFFIFFLIGSIENAIITGIIFISKLISSGFAFPNWKYGNLN